MGLTSKSIVDKLISNYEKGVYFGQSLFESASVSLFSVHSHYSRKQTGRHFAAHVTDPSGSVVPNAQVLIQEVGTNAERKVTTDENGNYEAPALQPGRYVMKVEADGFRGFQAEDVLLDARIDPKV